MRERVKRNLVWDIPTRVFHWLLVCLFGFSWWCAETDHMDWHRYSGLTICGLLTFRILWGFVGTDTARFSHFVKGPRAILAYLRPSTNEPYRPPLGHNPLGGWSVIALLLVLCVQVITGLFAVDVDGIESGPLSYLVDFDKGRIAAAIHHVSFDLLLALIGLHLIAVLFYLFVRGRNLIWPMIVGSQPVSETDGVSANTGSLWRLVFSLLAAALVAYALASGLQF